MYPSNEKLFLFNPFDVKRWTVEEIEAQTRALLEKYDPDADTMYELAMNVEIISNITFLFGEMIARLGKTSSVLKLECDTEEGKQIYLARKNYSHENPNDKTPAIKYFESKAKEIVHDKRLKQFEAEEQELRFRKAYDSYENIMNAIKKKLESVKYEIGL